MGGNATMQLSCIFNVTDIEDNERALERKQENKKQKKEKHALGPDLLCNNFEYTADVLIVCLSFFALRFNCCHCKTSQSM